MITSLNKPRITTDPRRDDYSATVIVRWRRNWRKMTTDERRAVLTEAAAYLETIAAQMRDEAETT